tara:strand:+ start:914 stop:1093 length:180 start_codon:yes stop_codon:yes gene_type:complete
MDEINITYAKYHAYNGENTAVEATIDGETMVIGLDTKNRHYAEILRQVEAGTLTIQDAD